jgi:hypothetical protein
VKKSTAALFVFAILAGQGMPGVSLAADLPLKPPPAKTAPVKPKAADDFDKLGADCIAATDGCRGYVRAADGKFDATGNIGIACQPKLLVCTKRR